MAGSGRVVVIDKRIYDPMLSVEIAKKKDVIKQINKKKGDRKNKSNIEIVGSE